MRVSACWWLSELSCYCSSPLSLDFSPKVNGFCFNHNSCSDITIKEFLYNKLASVLRLLYWKLMGSVQDFLLFFLLSFHWINATIDILCIFSSLTIWCDCKTSHIDRLGKFYILKCTKALKHSPSYFSFIVNQSTPSGWKTLNEICEINYYHYNFGFLPEELFIGVAALSACKERSSVYA